MSQSLNALQPTPVYDAFWRFAAERQAIFERRKHSPLGPWTTDPVLRDFKFTNVYRVTDRTTQYLVRNVIYNNEVKPDSGDAIFRILLFKIFNKIETWEFLTRTFGTINIRDFSAEHFGRALSDLMSRGVSIYSGAYIMPTGGRGFRFDRKHEAHLAILNQMLEAQLPARAAEAKSLEKNYLLLRSFPLMGEFLGYQYAIDINYSEATDFSESDFVVAGPGARSGIRKCFGNAANHSFSEVISMVTEAQAEEFEKRGLAFPFLGGRMLQQIDRKSTRLNSSHTDISRMPSSA